MSQKTAVSPALLPTRETQAYIGNRSRWWLYEQLKKDSTFPRPVKTGAHTIAWIRSELDSWIASRPRAVFDGVSAVDRKRPTEGAPA
jgi:prophage regulatory protein